MDENNLDSLLDELSSMDDELNQNIDEDSGVSLASGDMDDISLEELDNLDSIDLGDMDFDDIDFDDVDITNLDASANPVVQKKKPEEDDVNLDALIEKASEEQVKEKPQTEVKTESDDSLDDVFGEADHQMEEDTALPEGVFDDALFHQVTESQKPDPKSAKPDEPDMSDLMSDYPDMSDLMSDYPDMKNQTLKNEENQKSPYTAGEDSLDALLQSSMEESLMSGDLADIEDISQKPETPVKKQKRRKTKNTNTTSDSVPEKEHTKKTISEILFGAPDEDDIEEEAFLKEKKAKKAEEKQKKKAEAEAKKEARNAAKQEMLAAKQDSDKKKKEARADKKRQRDEMYAAEAEAEKGEKKVSTPVVIVVFVLFFALAGLVVLGTNNFSYSQVIKKATNYFERQRYRLAYDEVSGVEVKEKDQNLKDRIYTVMYVERLYESYENNRTLGRMDKALDALLRGLEKYDEHYAEAVELDIVKDIDSCREKILNALWNTYGITEDTAYQILAMDGQAYSKTLLELSEKIAQTETPTDAHGK